MNIWKYTKLRRTFYLLTLLLGVSQSVYAVFVDVNGTTSDYEVLAYNSSQDLIGGAVIEDNGTTIRLNGNTWKKIPLNYTVTENTVLQFNFQSATQGEIHGIGLCVNDRDCRRGRAFRLYGTQDWGIDAHNTYSSNAPNWKTYTIPVGRFFTGRSFYLFLMADKDYGDQYAESAFRNIRIYEGGDNPDNLPYATTNYAEPSHFKQASDINNIVLEDSVMTYEFLPHGGLHGDGAFKGTPSSGTDEDNTGWKIPNLYLANNSREPLFVSGVYYFSEEWVEANSGGAGVKFIDFALYSDDSRISSIVAGRGDSPRFDGDTRVSFGLNRGGAGWHFNGRSFATDRGLFLEDVAGMWFWLGYYIDFENNRVSAYVKTGPEGPYPTVTRVLHRTNNNAIIIANGDSGIHRHPWVRGETITGQTSGATAILDDYTYGGIIVTPISGDFIDQYDVNHNGVQGELIVGSQSGAWRGRVAAENWNWDRTTEGLQVGFSGLINGYWDVNGSVAKTTNMCHIVDEVSVGNGWIDPPTFPTSEHVGLNRCLD